MSGVILDMMEIEEIGEDGLTFETFDIPTDIRHQQLLDICTSELFDSFEQAIITSDALNNAGLAHSTSSFGNSMVHIGPRDVTSGFDPFTENNLPSWVPEKNMAPELTTMANSRPWGSIVDEDDQHQESHSDEQIPPAFNGDRFSPSRATQTERGVNNQLLNMNGGFNDKDSSGCLPGLAQPNDINRKRIQDKTKLASEKFRAKVRVETRDLEDEEQAMMEVNRDLVNCVADLRYEIYKLKTQLLQHGLCDDDPIQNYISNEAKRFVDGLP
ncbi:hypothetical protein BGZ63DRAFT_406393 [Mariannaea sp. PMI_226]|nr:hypothetical protein BGZ63DRAFT_406393 [Mariannaea sp. PMI_226]